MFVCLVLVLYSTNPWQTKESSRSGKSLSPDLTSGHSSEPHWTSSCHACHLGINMVKRKLAAHDNLKITIEQSGDKFHVKESSNFRTLDIDFTLGVTFEYSLADGTELSVSTVELHNHSRRLFSRAIWGIFSFLCEFSFSKMLLKQD